MIIGVGTDIVEVDRIRRSLERFGDRFVEKILAESEYRKPGAQGLAGYLARQFAAKEAVAKVLGTGMRSGVHFRDIVVLRLNSGAPVVSLEGQAKLRGDELGISTIHISISDERDYAIAYAIATA